MSRRRCVLLCKDRSATLFSLPRVEHVKRQWLEFIFATIPQKYSPNLLLCSRHFTEESFKNLYEFKCGFVSRLFLKEGSVPSVHGSASSSSAPQSVSIFNNDCCYVFCCMRNMYFVVCVAQLLSGVKLVLFSIFVARHSTFMHPKRFGQKLFKSYPYYLDCTCLGVAANYYCSALSVSALG